jgi:hypothetical protein
MTHRQGRLVWLIVLVLAIALWYQSYGGRRDLWRSQVNFCEKVAVPGALDGAARDSDLSQFASDAAAARRASGQLDVAAKYATIAAHAGARSNRTRARAAVPCNERFPHPSIWG